MLSRYLTECSLHSVSICYELISLTWRFNLGEKRVIWLGLASRAVLKRLRSSGQVLSNYNAYLRRHATDKTLYLTNNVHVTNKTGASVSKMYT